MAQVKILVTNIHDVNHRAASEAEINVYLKMGFKINSTHQHINPDNGFVMLTSILEKEGDEKADAEIKEQPEVKEPLKATADTTEKKADPAVKADQEVKENTEEKPVEEKKEEKEETGTDDEKSEKDSGGEENKESPDSKLPQGFKIKEKTESQDKEERE